ncbi:MAG: ketoacyl-ACP synthase III [Rubripirellula sp.]|nr:ketoacyl-ACP synthase III [Rubripirellula sp.]
MSHIRALGHYLPRLTRDNETLAKADNRWTAEEIYSKTGIRSRFVASADQTATDLVFEAAENLLQSTNFDRSCIDTIIMCTQSGDYFLPSSACVLQERLKIPTSCAAFDFNLGCSGFTYGLWLADALIRSQSAQHVLLLCGDTYSKYCPPENLATSSIFGDAGAAALIQESPENAIARIGSSILGTDGGGAKHLRVSGGGARSTGEPRTLHMNGPEVFAFTLGTVKKAIFDLLEKQKIGIEDIDIILPHQANAFMLGRIQKSLGVPASKFPCDMEDTGNTVSASIPILIERCMNKGLIQPGMNGILAGFGVGYSWGITYCDFLEGIDLRERHS